MVFIDMQLLQERLNEDLFLPLACESMSRGFLFLLILGFLFLLASVIEGCYG